MNYIDCTNNKTVLTNIKLKDCYMSNKDVLAKICSEDMFEAKIYRNFSSLYEDPYDSRILGIHKFDADNFIVEIISRSSLTQQCIYIYVPHTGP